MSDLPTSFKKIKENIEKSTHMAPRLHCCGLTGSLMLCLITELQINQGAPGTAWNEMGSFSCSLPTPCFARGRHYRQLEVALPDPGRSQGLARNFLRNLLRRLQGIYFQKETQRRSQLSICYPGCLSESLL